MSDDEALWRRRFHMFALVRLAGVAMFLLGMAIAYSDLLRPGGWPLVGGILALCGVVDAIFAPKLLRRAWENEDR
ncbi:hypothetical protein [Sphingomonas mesophila]|uniref:hypothetical protein n=1 Tax=Sphingomonas mesophila TaxID=2303576 RepID=UPI000E58C62F|nr:hypothetical protein [Sphingomonas mesophila]